MAEDFINALREFSEGSDLDIVIITPHKAELVSNQGFV